MEMSFTLKEIRLAAKQFWKSVVSEKVIAFHGQLGAGKTTFIKALCLEKQVTDHVGSPTFSLINEYQSEAGIIYHIDLFRVLNQEEAIQAGIEDCLYSGNICLVEWPEKAVAIFPSRTVHAYLTVIDEETRHFRIEDY